MPGSNGNDSTAPKKGIRERIMDCLTSRDESVTTQKMIDDEDNDTQECMDSYLRELTRSPLSKTWNQYRHKKWAHDDSLPPLEELEKEMVALVPSYSAFCHIGKSKELDCAFIPLFPFERPHLQDTIQKGMISRRSLHLRFNRQIDSVSSNLLDYLTNVDMFDHLAVGCTVYENGHWQTIATARVIRERDQPEWAEWAAIVADPYHRNTIGTCLLYFISRIALKAGVKMLYAVVNPANAPVLHWMKKLGAKVQMRQNVNVWCFPIPLPEDWVENQEVREQIDRASAGENIVAELVETYVRENFACMNML